MKKPYREGMWFDVPLGNGARARAVLIRDRHHVLDIAVCAADGTSIWSGSVSDRGLLVNRWRALDGPTIEAPPEYTVMRRFLRTAHAERAIARASGVPIPDERPLRVYDCGRIDAAHSAAFREATRIQWRAPLDPTLLAAARTKVESDASVAIRLYGGALDDIARIAGAAPRSLELARLPERMPLMPSVVHLTIEEITDVAALVAPFPNLQTLRLAGRGHSIALAPLRALPALRALDCSRVRIADWPTLAMLTNLRALRLCRIGGLRNFEALRALSLETLAVEEAPELHDLVALSHLRTLQQIDLRGLWQFNVDDLAWMGDLPHLMRATIDIGGRRKNAEVYRRGSWACAWPFYFSMV